MHEIRFREGDIFRTIDGDYIVQMKTASPVEPLYDMFNSEKLKVAQIKYHRKKRSLTANGALWHLLQLMAEKLNTSKEELYVEMLKKYGQFTHLIVKPDAAAKTERQFRVFQNLGEKEIGGKKGVQYLVYFGSSTYDAKEFAHLLDGVISEAKELGIDFISTEERTRLLEEWE